MVGNVAPFPPIVRHTGGKYRYPGSGESGGSRAAPVMRQLTREQTSSSPGRGASSEFISIFDKLP